MSILYDEELKRLIWGVDRIHPKRANYKSSLYCNKLGLIAKKYSLVATTYIKLDGMLRYIERYNSPLYSCRSQFRNLVMTLCLSWYLYFYISFLIFNKSLNMFPSLVIIFMQCIYSIRMIAFMYCN